METSALAKKETVKRKNILQKYEYVMALISCLPIACLFNNFLANTGEYYMHSTFYSEY
jgi:hypothetical protein